MTDIDKQGAARFLGVSTRSIERFVTAGKLIVTYTPGRTRRRPQFDLAQLQALKATLDRPECRTGGTNIPPTGSTSEAVAFRLPPEYMARISEQAANRNLSAGSFARQIVIDHLEAAAHVLAEHDIALLRHEIQTLSDNIAAATHGILVHVGQINHDDAKDWVLANIRTVANRASE